MPAVSRPAARAAPAGLLVVAIVLLALNLRGPIVAVTPVLDVIGADLRASAPTVALLVSLPVLCFGLLTPPASWLLARAGTGRGVLVALGLLLLGTVVRSTDGLVAALAGTVLIGAGITVCNVAVPVVIGRDLPRHAGSVLGAYTAALNVGSMITLSLTAPLAGPWGWRPALLAWGVLVLLGGVVWWAATRGADRTPPQPSADRPGPGADWWRRPLTWGLAVAFAGQAFTYYGLTAWLPILLRDLVGLGPEVAGVASSTFQVAGIVGAVVVGLLLRRGGPPVAMTVTVVLWAVALGGLLLAPAGWVVWCSVAGVAQGAGLTTIFASVVRGARDTEENRRMSATVQGVGYLVAAAGPAVLGAVHESVGGWTAPLLVACTSIAVLAVAGIGATARLRSG